MRACECKLIVFGALPPPRQENFCKSFLGTFKTLENGIVQTQCADFPTASSAMPTPNKNNAITSLVQALLDNSIVFIARLRR